MNTRALDSLNITRSSVTTATLVQKIPHGLILQTRAICSTKKHIYSADGDINKHRHMTGLGDQIKGSLKIELISDDAVRVRYSEGNTVPENKTPMVVGALPPAGKVAFAEFKDESGGKKKNGITLTTKTICVKVMLEPFRIEIFDRKGKLLTGIGGEEKNFFCNWDAINTGLCHSLESKSPIGVECFDLAHDEAIYGFGEKFIHLNKVGQTIDLDMTDALGVITPRSYKNIPFYASTKGYGVYFNHSSRMTFWVGSRSTVNIQAAIEDDFLDYTIFTGSLKKILSDYTTITGKGCLPPKWSFGYWQSKISYSGAEETLEIARNLRKHKFPCDVIHLDTYWFERDWYCDLQFSKDRFPDLAGYFAQMKALGINISLWQLPYIPEHNDLFDRLAAVDGFVKTTGGEIFNLGLCFTPGFKGRVGVIDFTHPKAVEIYKGELIRLFKIGASVIKTDFGEAAPAEGVTYYDGTPAHQMHNLYPLLYNKAAFEATQQTRGEGLVWGRSAWAGNQRYPLYWGGDNSANFANMPAQLAGGLSFGMSGFAFWSQDTGGFIGEMGGVLFLRWLQMAVFLSHMRIHGFGMREPYNLPPKARAIAKKFLHLRYRLLPYIYGQAQECVKSSLPMARALVLEFQNDPVTRHIDDEYLFGSNLLVAPIFDESAQRTVYLPEGRWYDWWTGKVWEGKQWINVKAPLDRIPLFVREGAVIALGPVLQYVNEKTVDQLELIVAPLSQDGKKTTTLSIDDRFVTATYTCLKGKHTIKIPKANCPIKIKVLGGKHKIRVE
ncbi:MAG: glycoside hydrolase family 31 protein [Verrucomicrobiota bacterium]|nr:glycoside hydrolase family 31 protein [Verrucomicrobiota bacterium]